MIKKITLLSIVFGIFSCSSSLDHDYSIEQVDEKAKTFGQRPIIIENKGLRLVEITDFPIFEDVKLNFFGKNVKYIEGKNKFEFSIDGFNLGEKTASEEELELMAEDGGQYLFIDRLNSVETKSFSSLNQIDLNSGDNYLVAFLCRSYRMSLKSKSSALFLKITTNNQDGALANEENEPFLILNSPVASYDITKNKKILFDFYLLNTTIGKNGNYLHLSIDGKEFKIYKWAPFYIEGLDMGKHTIKITLKDSQHKEVTGNLIKEITKDFEITDSNLFE